MVFFLADTVKKFNHNLANTNLLPLYNNANKHELCCYGDDSPQVFDPYSQLAISVEYRRALLPVPCLVVVLCPA